MFLEHLKKQILKRRYTQGLNFARSTKLNGLLLKKLQTWVCSNLVKITFRPCGSSKGAARTIGVLGTVKLMRPQPQVRVISTHRTAHSALSSAVMVKNVFKTTRIAAGVSFHGYR
jgi:hypothetical protein